MSPKIKKTEQKQSVFICLHSFSFSFKYMYIYESLPATAPPAHSGFSKGDLGLYVMIFIIGTSVCDKNDSRTIALPDMSMAQWENCALRIQR